MVDKQSQGGLLGDPGPAMSKFEVVTAMAFAAFADAPVDVAVVEVGMGGRWDATNVINAPVAVITPVGIDHVEYLGGDIAGIAGGAQVLQLQGLGGVYSDISLPLHGEHQAHNAVVALAAVEAFFGAGAQRQLDIDAVRAGFAAATSPGRLERMRRTPTVFVDAAHNPAGAAALAQTLAEEFDFRFLVGVVSVVADKDVGGILAALEPVLDQIVVTHNGSPRALDVESLALAAQQWFGPERVITAENLRDA